MNKKNTNQELLDAFGDLFSEIFHEPIQFVEINSSEKPKPPEDEYADFLKCYEDCKDCEFRNGCDEAELIAMCDANCSHCDYKKECHENTIALELMPQKVIIHNPATIIYWTDGSKTVVRCHKDDSFDAEKGIVMATLKKISGNDGAFNNYINRCLDMAIVERG